MDFTQENWKAVCFSYPDTVISTRDKLIQLTYLPRTYFTPKILFCDIEQGDFLHMVWSCSKVRPFWSAVTAFISEALEMPNICNHKWCLLGVFDDVELSTKCFYTLCFTMPEKLLYCTGLGQILSILIYGNPKSIKTHHYISWQTKLGGVQQSLSKS